MKMTNNDWNRLRAQSEERSARAALDFFVEGVEDNIENIRNLLSLIEIDMDNIRKEMQNEP